jgi:hypothetical protein
MKISSVLSFFVLLVFLSSCKKDIRSGFSQQPIVEKNVTTSPAAKGVSIMTYPSGDYFSHFQDLFNGNYDVYVTPAAALHHIYKWQLLWNGIAISSGNVNIYDQPGQYEYLTTINSPASGTYTLNIYTNGFYDGSNWVIYSPSPTDPPFVSSESVLQTNTSGNIEMHRYFSPTLKDHFYTKTKTFYKDYQYENVEFTGWASSASGSAPLYRYWNPSIKDHFYTTTSGSYSGYQYETTECYVVTSGGTGLKPLYRYWNGSATDHFYTVTSGSYSGYTFESIAGYVQ